MNKYLSAFTLIELLVVITIIVVLLALLTPALDKAIYQAELAVCAAGLHSIGTGAQQYAVANKRRYPLHSNVELNTIYSPFDDEVDMRIFIREYMGKVNEVCQDPMVEKADLDGSLEGTYVYTSRQYYFGFQFHPEEGSAAGMFKMGDRWSWGQGEDLRRFSVLAADLDTVIPGEANATNSHPDEDGLLSNKLWQDEPLTGFVSPGAASATGVLDITFSFYWAGDAESHERGFTDMNYAMADGSVQRHLQVHWNEGKPTEGEYRGRVWRVPAVHDGNTDEEWHHAPLR